MQQTTLVTVPKGVLPPPPPPNETNNDMNYVKESGYGETINFNAGYVAPSPGTGGKGSEQENENKSASPPQLGSNLPPPPPLSDPYEFTRVSSTSQTFPQDLEDVPIGVQGLGNETYLDIL